MILTLEGCSHRIKMKFNSNKYSQQLGGGAGEESMQKHDRGKCKNAGDCMQIKDNHMLKQGQPCPINILGKKRTNKVLTEKQLQRPSALYCSISWNDLFRQKTKISGLTYISVREKVPKYHLLRLHNHTASAGLHYRHLLFPEENNQDDTGQGFIAAF